MDVDSPVQASSPSAENKTPAVNGTNGVKKDDEAPAPPPHKSPSPPARPTPEEAEAFKTAGNTFYKNKEFRKAIEEYSKGRLSAETRGSAVLTCFSH
jgi:DnaJ family protein C protein 7